MPLPFCLEEIGRLMQAEITEDGACLHQVGNAF